jgi:hypothetical protein
MNVNVCQRWRERQGLYRPLGEPIRTCDYEVSSIDDDRTARAFVVAHHYSGSFPAARFRYGLYRRDELVGVAVFSVPTNDRSTAELPGAPRDKVELGRFVLLDDVPSNGESWFLARAFTLLRPHVAGVVSFADPEARASLDGSTVFPGHLGTIYQATNASYRGRGQHRTWRLLPDGTVLSARAISKIRAGERGWRYAADLLVHAGAPEPGPNLREWLAEWLPRVTRTFRHRGTHKYVWSFARARVPSLPYPKWRLA